MELKIEDLRVMLLNVEQREILIIGYVRDTNVNIRTTIAQKTVFCTARQTKQNHTTHPVIQSLNQFIIANYRTAGHKLTLVYKQLS